MNINNQVGLFEKKYFQTNQQSTKSSSEKSFTDYMESLKSSTASKVSATEDASVRLTISLDTNKGTKEINLDDYLTPKAPSKQAVGFHNLPPLLLPTQHNVDTLANYSEQKMRSLMQEYDIPVPPTTIEFDQEGGIVLPSDYQYASQLKQALNDNPVVSRAIRTTGAIASQYAGILEGQPFRDEMSTARTQADRDRIVDKYGYLFDDNRSPIRIVLSFLDDGSMLVGAKGGVQENETLFKVNS